MPDALPPDELADAMLKDAATFVEVHPTLAMDFSPESLLLVDKFISETLPFGVSLDSTIILFGAYVGETVRRNLGGDWLADEEDNYWLQNIGGTELKLMPLRWAANRFKNGSEDALTYKYAVTAKMVTGDEEAFHRLVEAVKGLNLHAMDRPQFADEMLAQTPLLVFMLVAAADGKVDQKEKAALMKMTENLEKFPSPLFQTAVHTMMENTERYMGQFSAEDFDYTDHLSDCIEVLDDEHPAEAKEFKECLMAWGKAIAEASGGFLGFGKKLGKEEAETLDDIATLLGLGGDSLVVEGDRLPRAPLLVFMLVAAADGNVDQKELEMLGKLTESLGKFPCPLFQAAVKAMANNADRYFKEFQAEGFDAVEELKAAAQALDAEHPESAQEFKHCLIIWGGKIAEASSGFKGLGEQMGEAEGMNLAMIGIILGMVDEHGKLT